MRKTLALSLISAFALTFGACGDDGPTGPDISQQQAEEVAAAVSNGVFQGFGIVLGGGGGAASGAPEAFRPWSDRTAPTLANGSYTFDDGASCPQGGSLSVSGDGTVTTTQTQNATTTEWDWNAEASYSSCGVAIDDGQQPDAISFVLDTSAPIQFTGNGSLTAGSAQLDGGDLVSTVGTSGTFTWNYSGTIEWDEQGGPSATCGVDLTTTLSVTGNESFVELSGAVSGTACGHDVDRPFSATFSA